MDKSTLSNYGWIVIAVLVLSVMIALATPFGQYIENGVRSTTEGLFSTSQNAMNSAFGDLGVEVKDQTFEEGYTGGQAGTTPNNPETPPTEEPEELVAGATFSDGTFLTWDELQMEANGEEYMYDSYAISSTSIGDYAFADCSSLVSIVLPNTITIIGERAFAYTSLTVAPLIPKSVQHLDACIFAGCNSITEVRYDGTLNEFSKITTNDWIDEAPIRKLICTDTTSEHFFGN